MTAHIYWIPQYSVGSKTLDDQHKSILEICARIQLLSKSDPDYLDQLHIALNDMSEYASRHFKDEEQILANIDYTALEEHRKEHNHYHELLSELLIDAIEGNPDARKMSRFLEEWWIDHILDSDMKYKSLLIEANS